MSSVWNKIDLGLAQIYADYLRVREHGRERVPRVHPVAAGDGRINVMLHFTAALAEVQALGFEALRHEDEDRAMGTIDLANLEQLAADPGVLRIAFGQRPEPQLDVSVPDVRATDVWTLGPRRDSFSGGTGRDVVVGVIDSGIDFFHRFFRHPVTGATRIKRIWDQGLTPRTRDGERSPDASLLSGSGGGTYGVEYTEDQINESLQQTPGRLELRHRDCNGHGTHVASIAAGNGSPEFTHVGVAPEADLIIVKLLDLADHPELNDAPAPESQLFYDAVSYIRGVAAGLDKPVAINVSLVRGVDQPHDGFTDEEDWLTRQFSSASGEVLVAGAGNDAGYDHHVRIEFARAGTVTIPLKLYDDRTLTTSRNTCAVREATEPLHLELWYPHGGAMLTANLVTPDAFRIRGPDLGANRIEAFGGLELREDLFGPLPWRVGMFHLQVEGPLHSGARYVRKLWTAQFPVDGDDGFLRGDYQLEVESTGRMTAHLWCRQLLPPGFGYGFHVDTPVSDSRLHVEDRHLIKSYGGADNVICVAGYNAEVPGGPAYVHSSRGPLVDYGGAPPQPVKPDLAAPGVHIDAAKSRDISRILKASSATVRFNGTSMATPHVTGAVALMLEATPTLSPAEVLDILRTTARPAGDSEVFGAGLLNVERAVAMARLRRL